MALVAVYLLWPALRPGDLLGRDMVFTPYPKLDLAALGLAVGSPRAVPLDSVVGVATAIFGSQLTGRLALIGTVVLVASGARALVARAVLPARLAAISLALVNPFVVERLAIGQWPVVAAYGALAWLLTGVCRFLDGGSVSWLLAAIWIASLTPTGGLLAAGVVLIAAALGTGRVLRKTIAVALALVAQAPWVVAAIASGASLSADPVGVEVFQARPERPGPVLLTLMTGGGIWNSQTAVPSQNGPLGWGWLLLVVGVLIAGWSGLSRMLGTLRRPLVVVGLGGVLLALLPVLPLGQDLMEWASRALPGAGLLRDSQKWIAPWVLLVVVVAATAVDRLARSLRPPATGFATLAAITVPLALLPDAAVVLGPTLRPVGYSEEWDDVRAAVRPGDVTLVLPRGSYRNFSWMDERPAIDPAPRMLPGVVITDDTLIVGDTPVAGESGCARAAFAALDDDDPVAALVGLGVSLVLIEQDTPGASRELPGTTVHRGEQLILVRISESGADEARVVRAVAAVGAHGLYALLLVGAFVSQFSRSREKTRKRSPETTGE